MTEEKKVTRKNSPPIKVYCFPEEKIDIENQALASGLSASTYLRNVGLGYQIKGILDHQRVDDMAKINADLGRLGGLLKLWLTNDEKLIGLGMEPLQMHKTILAALSRIEDNQKALREIMKAVVLT